MKSHFFIADIIRAIREKKVLETSSDLMVRDYMTPIDFHQIISVILHGPAINDVIDCFTKAPVEKSIMLDAMSREFGLQFKFADRAQANNITGYKPQYYSLNKKASKFGYQPKFSSIEGILFETKILLI